MSYFVLFTQAYAICWDSQGSCEVRSSDKRWPVTNIMASFNSIPRELAQHVLQNQEAWKFSKVEGLKNRELFLWTPFLLMWF